MRDLVFHASPHVDVHGCKADRDQSSEACKEVGE